ncbi:unnamed protein product [Mortierella alpina]
MRSLMSSSTSPSSRASSASPASESNGTHVHHSSEPAGPAVSPGDSLDQTPTPAAAAAAAETTAATTAAAAATTPRKVAAAIDIKLHPRKGQPLTHCRAPKDFPGPFDLLLSTEHDSYTTFCSKIRAQLTASLPEYSWPRDTHPYLRPTHSATQTHYKELTDDNFETRMHKAWRTESRRLDGTDEAVYIHVFAYLIKAEKGEDKLTNGSSRRTQSSANHTTATTHTTTASGSTDLVNGAAGSGGRSTVAVGNGTSTGITHSVTSSPTRHLARSAIAGTSVSPAIQAKMEEAERRIVLAAEQHIIPPLGPVSTEMFARHLAMLPTMPSAESLELPTTLTFRQAMQLDEQARGLKRRMDAEEAAGSDEFRTVRIKIQGVVMPVQIELRSLREALGLPSGPDAA